jgi:four helix bundle protein
VGANFIEAREAVSAKDFVYRVRVSRKETKETAFWLRLVDTRDDPQLEKNRGELVSECNELIRIMTSIIKKRESGN